MSTATLLQRVETLIDLGYSVSLSVTRLDYHNGLDLHFYEWMVGEIVGSAYLGLSKDYTVSDMISICDTIIKHHDPLRELERVAQLARAS